MTYDSSLREKYGSRIESYQRQLYSHLSKWLGPRAPIEDIAQDVCLEAWKSLMNRGPPEKLEAWMLGTAYNLAQDYKRRECRRRRGKRLQSRAAVDEATPYELAWRAEACEAARESLADLPELERMLVREHVFQERTIKEIKSEVEKSYGSLVVRIYRLRRKLRRELAAYLGLEGEGVGGR